MAVLNEETMLERGKFTANGYTFEVKPVYLGEESDYLSQVGVSPVPVSQATGEVNLDTTDKEKSQWIMALFSENINGVKKKKRGRFYELLSYILWRRDYRYYKDYPTIQPLIKWIEKKVTYKGKKVRFYELERKYCLSKADIERLFIYFHQLSGF